MKYTLSLDRVDEAVFQLLKKWIEDRYNDKFNILHRALSDDPIHIKVIQIKEVYDWVKYYRLQKHYNCFYILILDEALIHTSPLGVRLQAHSLLLQPLKKSAFFRAVNDAVKTLDHQQISLIKTKDREVISVHKPKTMMNESLENYMLRRLLHEDAHSEVEIMEALSLFKENDFPNTVCYVQGFIHLDHNPQEKNKAVQLIRTYFTEAFQEMVPRLYFIPFRKSMLILFRQTENVYSVRSWEEGRRRFEWVIRKLLDSHRIQIYIGVGSLYNNPKMLHHSFTESKIARSLPPFYEVSLRYFEEISKEPDIVKATRYIEEHFSEEITAKEIALHLNLSYSHFVRLFKKETGNTFSEYITFVRLRKGVWNLRYTDKTIEEISNMVGFNTHNYFSSTFKKYIGITPSVFRLTKEILFA